MGVVGRLLPFRRFYLENFSCCLRCCSARDVYSTSRSYWTNRSKGRSLSSSPLSTRKSLDKNDLTTTLKTKTATTLPTPPIARIVSLNAGVTPKSNGSLYPRSWHLSSESTDNYNITTINNAPHLNEVSMLRFSIQIVLEGLFISVTQLYLQSRSRALRVSVVYLPGLKSMKNKRKRFQC